MIDSLIAFSVRNKVFVAVVTAIMTLVGIFSITRLPIDAVPDITNNQVLIITQNPNLAPLEIEKFITAPIELAMANIPGLREIRSISKFGLSNVTLIFDDAVDVYRARQLVFERLKELENDVPPDMGVPTLAPVSTGLGEIYQYFLKPIVDGDTTYSPMDIRTIQDWVVRKMLLSTDGVADVSSFGGYVKEYQAKVNPALLRATGVTMDELFNALRGGTGNTGGAYLEKDKTAFVIRGIGLATNLQDIKNIYIKDNRGLPVYVKDVAEVEFGHAVRYGALSADGKGEVVGGIVMMRKGENATKVVQNIKAKIEEINKILPEGLVVQPFLSRDDFVNRAIKTVLKNLVEAFFIVIAVVLLFLGDFKASLLVSSVVILSMLFAVTLMVIFGVSGNLMSLGAIDFGLMVDPAIIIVESVAVALTLEQSNLIRPLNMEDKNRTIIIASINVKKSVVFGGLIILVVYFPIMTLSGIEGKMFTPMALTVSFAIIGAILLALTYIPMMCAVIVNAHDPNHPNFADKFVAFMLRYFEPLFLASVRYKYGVVFFAFNILLVSGFVFSKLGGEFIPKLDEGDYNIEVRMPVGTSLEETKLLASSIQKQFKQHYPSCIKHVVSKIGTSEIPTDPMPFEAMDIIVALTDANTWTDVQSKAELTLGLSKILDKYPGITYSIQQPIENRFNDLLSGAKTDVVIKVFGNDLIELNKIGNQIAKILQNVQGATDVQVQKVDGLPQIIVKYDRRLVSLYGISVEEINRLIKTAFAGSKTGTIYEGERRFPLSVRLASEERNSIEDLMNLQIATKDGTLIPLKEISDIKEEKGPAEITRENGQRRLNVGFNVRGRDVESVVKDAAKRIDKEISLPYKYYLDFGGEFENLNRAKERLIIVVPISLLIIFFLLYATFGNIPDSLLIFSAIPLSAIGGIFALYLRDMSFSISAGIGFIALFGISVLNGILLIGKFKELQSQHGYSDIIRRVRSGLNQRFRQVLMTSATAALGFLPMALSNAAGAEVQKPLATVVIGGLISSTILTLIVLPNLYIIFNSRRLRLQILKS